MLINEVCKKTGLTKKAVEYYIEQDLICPAAQDNGYRDFTAGDEERLRIIAALRKLGLSALDIKAVLSDETGEALRSVAVRNSLASRRAEAKSALLDKLSANKLTYAELCRALEALEKGATITQRLLDAFPGYFGRFIALHFARFLNEPVATEDQIKAYREITEFLDSVPELVFPQDIKEYFDENTRELDAMAIDALQENSMRALADISAFLDTNEAFLDEYIAFKRSSGYNASLPGRLEMLMKKFCASSGYYSVFIPAMKRLSAPYAAYTEKMEAANEMFIARYPELAVGAGFHARP